MTTTPESATSSSPPTSSTTKTARSILKTPAAAENTDKRRLHIVHAVNAYFTDHGTPARINGQMTAHAGDQYEVYPGVIGSGEAVIADRASDIRTYLTTYHEKVLAVDMEVGGLGQYWQENSVHGTTNPGWIVIRGVSDNADEHKGHSHHELAARNAAHVLSQLLPYF